MKQIIPYVKEIVFKTNVASITSISLEHEEKVYDGEVSGDFIVFGDYKVHNDTTEREIFKYRLPFTAILPDTAIKDSIKIDIEDFTYDQVEDDVIKINIDFSVNFTEEERVDEEDNEVIDGSNKIDEETIKEIEDFLRSKDEVIDEEKKEVLEEKEEEKAEEVEEALPEEREEVDTVVKQEIKEEHEEYVKYHIHIVKENETLEQIIALYETNMETMKEYNDIEKIKKGDKLIIPEYVDE